MQFTAETLTRYAEQLQTLYPFTASSIVEVKEENESMLTVTGRNGIQDFLEKACNKTYTINGKSERLIDPTVHTDTKINQYNDAQLVSYQAAVIIDPSNNFKPLTITVVGIFYFPKIICCQNANICSNMYTNKCSCIKYRKGNSLCQ